MTKLLPGRLRKKAVYFLSVKFTNLTVLNLTKLGPLETGSILKILLRYIFVVKEILLI